MLYNCWKVGEMADPRMTHIPQPCAQCFSKISLSSWKVLRCFHGCDVQLLAMRSVSATEAAVIFTLEPLWGAAFAWFLLGERWGLRGWIGAAFILGKWEHFCFQMWQICALGSKLWGPCMPFQFPFDYCLPCRWEFGNASMGCSRGSHQIIKNSDCKCGSIWIGKERGHQPLGWWFFHWDKQVRETHKSLNPSLKYWKSNPKLA